MLFVVELICVDVSEVATRAGTWVNRNIPGRHFKKRCGNFPANSLMTRCMFQTKLPR